MFIRSIHVRDARFELEPGQGFDAVHSKPEYFFAVTLISLDTGLEGTRFAPIALFRLLCGKTLAWELCSLFVAGGLRTAYANVTHFWHICLPAPKCRSVDCV